MREIRIALMTSGKYVRIKDESENKHTGLLCEIDESQLEEIFNLEWRLQTILGNVHLAEGEQRNEPVDSEEIL